ncbi:MAG: formylglycine-generating enzyme family protein [Deltaproteobacteria bacterium]|nr:formylglycine-generating enzyme family protein [Deltaproteobacteria bacterium]
MKSSTEEREWKIARHPPGASLFAWDRFGVCVEFQVQDTRFKMRWIPPGSFVMGSPSDEPGRWEAEGPQHRVHIERGFWLGATPVTQGQYLAVTKKTPSYFKNAGFDAPVESVSWQEAREFCKGLTEKLPHLQPGSSFGLPSEAQWEYACRAGTQTALYTGNITIKGENNAPELDPIAWYGGNSGVEYEGGGDSSGWKEKQYESQRSGTHPVARKKPNALGLYDMLGNVWEWCEDDWHGDYQNAPTDGSAWVGPGDRQGRYRVLRGGSWISSARRCRSAARDGFGSGLRDHDLGFRLVLAPSSTENPEDFLEQEERVQRTVSAVPRAEPGQKQDTESETSRPPGWLGTIRQAIFGKDKDEDKKRG